MHFLLPIVLLIFQATCKCKSLQNKGKFSHIFFIGYITEKFRAHALHRSFQQYCIPAQNIKLNWKIPHQLCMMQWKSRSRPDIVLLSFIRGPEAWIQEPLKSFLFFATKILKSSHIVIFLQSPLNTFHFQSVGHRRHKMLSCHFFTDRNAIHCNGNGTCTGDGNGNCCNTWHNIHVGKYTLVKLPTCKYSLQIIKMVAKFLSLQRLSNFIFRK